MSTRRATVREVFREISTRRATVREVSREERTRTLSSARGPVVLRDAHERILALKVKSCRELSQLDHDSLKALLSRE
jgi:hypothetical protein